LPITKLLPNIIRETKFWAVIGEALSMKYLPVAILFALVFSFVIRCEHGLSPSDAKQIPKNVNGISGAIIYKNWPSADSLKDLRLVAFRKFPPQNILTEILNKTAIVYPPIDTSAHLEFYVPFEEYVMGLPPDTFEYIVVAQQYGDNIATDWRAVGQYDTDEDSLPTPIIITEKTFLEGININVDFKHLPIQPF
jgi:hypothetical protein